MTDGRDTTIDWQRHARRIAVLPLGAMEQHGAHMPLLTDTIQAEYFARRLAEDLDAALLPVIPFGQSYEHTGFRGTFSFRPETYMAIIRDLTDEVERQGFDRLVLVNGHGGNFALTTVVRDINRSDRDIKVLLANWWESPAYSGGPDLPPDEVHGGARETSVMLAVAPDLVRDPPEDDPRIAVPDARRGDLTHHGFGVLRPDGLWGDPRKASVEEGRRMVESIRVEFARFVRERLARFDEHPQYGGKEQIVLRPMIARDIEDGVRLCRLTGWNQLAADWDFFLGLRPEGCFVAVHDGRVMGTATSVDYAGLVGWIAMVLVDPEYRRRGVATRLMEAALESLSECETVKLDATPAGRGVYAKLGFEDEYVLSRMVVERMPIMDPPDLEAVRPMEDADMDAVVALDTDAFGVERRAVVEGFRALAPEYAMVALGNDGSIIGFTLGRHGAKREQIGPVVAGDALAARVLSSAAFAVAAGKPVVVDAPHISRDWIEWLRSLGFVEERPFIRMVRGPNSRPGLPERQYAVSGPELG